MRARALALAPLAVLALAAPAAAQSATPTATVTPTATPTATVNEYPPCRSVEVEWPATPVAANAPVEVKARMADGQPAKFNVTRIAPGEPTFVRQSAEAATSTVFTFRLPETTTLVVAFEQGACLGNEERVNDRRTLTVRPNLTIAATRNSARDYTFSGTVTPGRGQAVTLYRVNADGSRIITARSTVQPDGRYRLRRVFTGSGRFGFEARVGASSTNVAGASTVRPTVIH